MTDPFILKLILSFITGSLWITIGTVLAERYGTKIGGLVAGLPSTILVSLFFIAWTQSVETATAATTVVPIVGGINCLFIIVYIYLIRTGFWLALSGALAVWFFSSLILVIIGFNSFPFSVFAYICMLVFSYRVAEHKLSVRSESGKKMQYTAPIILSRGAFSGLVIVLAVVMTKIGGPLIGGAFAMFPAMFIGTLFITYFTHGASFSSAVMKSSIPGAVSVVVYGASVRYTYVPLGLLPGTLVSLLIAFCCSLLIHQFMTRHTT
ncbi:MAG TPA: DUF3147 family protein [Syntrophorhabdaceae bacterium]|nr:DUF3147 family protein [Syntrophorhabdaceae bacterium]HQM80069.1 DUF3147 family protein [Syntrophorhabdaceae bacterium]